MKKELDMEKVLDYAMKHLGARISSHKGWARMAVEGSKPNIHHLGKASELEKELEEIKEFKENINIL